jgi:hypothetical protein
LAADDAVFDFGRNGVGMHVCAHLRGFSRSYGAPPRTSNGGFA